MRVARRNVLLVGLVVLLGAANLMGLERRSTRATGPLLVDYDPTSVLSVAIARGEDQTRLLRDETGWVVTSKHEFPAFEEGVVRLLRQLGDLRRDDLVTSDRSKHQELGVHSLGLSVGLSGEGRVQELFVGSVGGKSFVRLMRSDDVYRAPTLQAPSPIGTSWLDPQPFRFDPTAVRSVHAVHPDEPSRRVRLERGADGVWRGSEEQVPGAAVTDWLRTISTLVINDVGSMDDTWVRSFNEPFIEIALPDDTIVLDLLTRDEATFVTREPVETASHYLAVPEASLNRIQDGLRALARASGQ